MNKGKTLNISGRFNINEEEYFIGVEQANDVRVLLVLQKADSYDLVKQLVGEEPEGKVLNMFNYRDYDQQHVAEYSIRNVSTGETVNLLTTPLKSSETINDILDYEFRGVFNKEYVKQDYIDGDIDVFEADNGESYILVEKHSGEITKFIYKSDSADIELMEDDKMIIRPDMKEQKVKKKEEQEINKSIKLSGTLSFLNNKYFVGLGQESKRTRVLILSEYTSSDRLLVTYGKNPVNPALTINSFRDYTEGHIAEYLVKNSTTNQVLGLPKRPSRISLKIFDTLKLISGMGFKPKDIISKEEKVEGTNVVKTLEANTGEIYIKYKKLNNKYVYLKFKNRELELELVEDKKIKINQGKLADLDVLSRKVEDSIYSADVSELTLEKAIGDRDISWAYDRNTGKFVRKYFMVESNEQFEKEVMTPLLQALRDAVNSGNKLLLSMDTETSGLNVYNLPKSNPIKDSIVTMQISWEDNQGALINFDMQYFGNCDVDYVMRRLHPLVKEYIGKKEKEETRIISDINGKTYAFKRSDIIVIGHNTIFDGRVSIDTGYQWFFDEDTMQLIFNLDPVGSKGKKGLKSSTHRLQGIEQLELSDTLGKGNEGRFAYISDKRLALLYGCADSDFTRLNWKKLRAITPDSMYKSYKIFHVYMWYILAQSEYDGIKIDEAKLKEGSETIRKNIEILEKFIYYSVGSTIRLNQIKEELQIKELAGKFTGNIDEEAERLLEEEKKNNNSSCYYEFKISGNDLKEVLYDKLKYKKTTFTKTGEPAVNKLARQRLKNFKYSDPKDTMKDHLYSSDFDPNNPECFDKGKPKKDYILINKDDYNKYVYPLAFVLDTHSAMVKEYTGYYKPFAEADWGGYIFKGFSTTNIETYRISNPIQTTKKGLKKVIIAYDKDFYAVNWDKAQIEARVFVAEAGDYRMVERLNDPEKDYHTENAALMFDKLPYLVSRDLRKAAKSINFGLPYGLGVDKMCESIHKVVNAENLVDTRYKIAKYKEVNKLTWDLLEGYRDRALEVWDCSDEYKKFLGYEGRTLGHAVNANGFHRVFDLTDVTENWQKEKVRRAAGNFPIQSYARDIFCYSIMKLFVRLGELGLRDKFKIHMLVHDEIQCSAHKSIDPVYLMKIFKECCMPRVACKQPAVEPDYKVNPLSKAINYFIGINFGANWYECKKDENECPINFVYWMLDKLESGEYVPLEWCDNPPEVIKPRMHQFFVERLHKEFSTIQPDVDTAPIDMKFIKENLTNYTVRAYTTDNFDNVTNYKGKDEDLNFYSCLMGWALEQYNGADREVIFDGKVTTISNLVETGLAVAEEANDINIDSILDDADDFEEIDFDMNEDGDYIDTDAVLDATLSVSTYVDLMVDSNNKQKEVQKPVEVIEEIKESKPTYDNLIITDNTILVSTTMIGMTEILNSNVLKTGPDSNKKIRFCVTNRVVRTILADSSIDLEKLNSLANS